MSPPAPLRVLHVLPRGHGPSSMIFARRQIDALQAAGVETRVLEISTSVLPWRHLRERGRLRDEVAAFDPHLVHAHFGTMTGWLCTSAAGRPVVVTFRGNDLIPDPTSAWLPNFARSILSKRAARDARRIVCVSRELLDRLPEGRDRAEVIPSGVDTARFRPLPREEARAALGWPPGEAVVLFSAGGQPGVKRLDLARRSVEEARKLAGAIRFEVLDGTVPPDRMPLVLNAADVLLFTSLCEGSPNIVKEAVACGLPVVSVEVGDVRERLDGVVPSAITEPKAEALGSRLAEQLKRGGRSDGPERAADFSLERTTERWLAAYRAALGPDP